MYNYKISNCNKHKVIIHMVYQYNNLNTQSSPAQQYIVIKLFKITNKKSHTPPINPSLKQQNFGRTANMAQ